ncbi:tetratricopeptide repeat protein [Kaistella flava (ex Peng et al. 2021)]|uniref:Tetratricopeptide repeat protein n=1 Tax=Kaistella flava (ex Peng et al. 2021) TaxID=2038776 RepID=A0A7M2Y7N0_9FLAO|nr:tetratricopeptide repeat protein [Kaistella flava (ex Peng et al. 2021)]QOW10278.1 tetratricopeptide repeat protein [Kaistella flava (ex Peng et al. 2021)]
MQIFHKINPFLFTLFNVAEGDISGLTASIKSFYTLDGIVPSVKEDNDIISVTVDFSTLFIDTRKYNELISLCESRKFQDAYPIAVELCHNNKSNSDLFRIKGQIESELGETDKAIDSLIDSLRWDPKNAYALIMMGNIFARDKDDIDTAMKYYNQATIVDPDDNISLNNIGANLLALKRYDEAEKYFEKAQSINPNYPNTIYALGRLAFIRGDNSKAFDLALKSVQLNKLKDELYQNSVHLIGEISEMIINSKKSEKILADFTKHIEEISDKGIEIEVDNSIPTAAKVEVAENHNRNYHLIKYKSRYPGVLHLILHELTHIELASEARLITENKLFLSTNEGRLKFLTRYNEYCIGLQKKGYSEESISNVINSLFDGLNRQIYNAPIDLFIEDRIFNNFPTFRPVQFTSLLTMLLEGLDAVTRKEVVELTDSEILSKSKIYNLINAFQFRDLFGIDFTKQFSASHSELVQAKKLYDEYIEYKDDKQPGEEYELIQNWGNDLKLDNYFQLIHEDEYYKTKIPTDDLSFTENIDPDTEANQQIEMHNFLENHLDDDLNPAVMMYMVGALKYFKNKSASEIKQTAFEIATLGINGINPGKKKGYSVQSIKGSDFSGYQMLAYYYVSWALSAPQLLPELKLPFDKEYNSAKNFI